MLKLILPVFLIFIGSVPEKEAISPYRIFNAPPGKNMVIFYSGDGGWRDFSVQICNFLRKNNIPTFGINTVNYFWEARTPGEIAADFEKIFQSYSLKWQTNQVFIIGYSFGADIIPAMINHLSSTAKKKIAGIILIAPSPYAQFEIKLINLILDPDGGRALMPDIEKIKNIPLYFICDNTDYSLAPLLDKKYDYTIVPGGHHFHYNYDRINAIILQKINDFTHNDQSPR